MVLPRCVLPALVACVVVAGACSSAADSGDATSAPVTSTQVDQTSVPTADGSSLTEEGVGEVFDDPGEPVTVTTGESFTLSLAANPTTGYEWTLTAPPDPTVLAVTGHRYFPDPDAEGATGIGGSDLWTFTAVGAGETSMTFTYARPSEPDADATSSTFHVRVS